MNANSKETGRKGFKTKIQIQNLGTLWHTKTLRDASSKSLEEYSELE